MREWVIDIGILAGSLYWVGFTIAGFIPVYFAGEDGPYKAVARRRGVRPANSCAFRLFGPVLGIRLASG